MPESSPVDRGVPIVVKVDVDVTFRASVRVGVDSGESFETAKKKALATFLEIAQRDVQKWTERTRGTGRAREINVATTPSASVRAISLDSAELRSSGWDPES